MKIRPAPGKGRRYMKCIYFGTGSHGIAKGAACMPCERDYTEVLRDHERHPEREPKPPKPRRTHVPDHPAFVLMAAEAERVGWPEHYATDLADWDRWLLVTVSTWQDHTAPFAWALRDMGTEIIRPWPDVCDNTPRQLFIRCARLAEIYGRDRVKFYVWDGTRLVASESPETADARLDREATSWRRACAEKSKALDKVWHLKGLVE